MNHFQKKKKVFTKIDLIEGWQYKKGISKKEAAMAIESVFDLLKESLMTQDQKIKLSGFGNFIVRHKKKRMGRNPQTGEQLEISARNILTFRASPLLREEVNQSS